MRLKFAARSEAFAAEQKSLLEETIDAHMAALAQEIKQRATADDKAKSHRKQPKRAAAAIATHGVMPRDP